MPQAPQFSVSKATLVQMPPQFVEPAGHSIQVPELQTGADAGQTYPQAPQLFASEFKFVHIPLQQVVPVAQQA